MAELIEESTQTGVVGAAEHVVGYPTLRHHAIARYGRRGPELLRVALPTGEEVLPLFSSEETARGFLGSSDLDGAWYVRVYSAGELASMLLGLYTGIAGVVLDPADEVMVEGYGLEDLVRWRTFIGYLLDHGRSASLRPAPYGASAVAWAL